MAKQLNVLSGGQVISTALHTEMQQSYLEYAMSVIVGRALPDVRDGLKPVHRRILYAMHELGLTPDRPYRKCARVVGDVLGKYHPHGDQAVYDALVRMVQEFSSRYPLLAGHGNFGSVDDDPPAAMRYTETRLASIGNEALLAEIGDETVDFTANFDNSQQEPTVLPAQLPILLLNGSSGIAVGMATNIPPHNLNEVVDGLIALIDHPDLPDERLLQLIPGPDFPTGGEIISQEGIREAYLTGRGSIPVRGVVQIEEVQPGRGRHRRAAIVVTELPYQVNKAAWIEKVADLVNQGRLDGVADIRDESDREGIRVVIELKREANLQKILAILYKQTALQSNFGTILLALDGKQPRQMSLRDLLQSFIRFREETLTRRYQHELTQAENRLHILTALLQALEHLDAIIAILRAAPDGSTAKATMQAQFHFDDRQADAILAMPLRRLTGMERQNLQTEFDERTARVAELQRLLGDRRELLKALKKDLRSLKKKFGDERRTKILGSSTEPGENQETRSQSQILGSGIDLESSTVQALLAEPEVEPEQEVVLEVTQRGYIRRIPPKTYQRSQSRMAEKPTDTWLEEDDVVTQTELATTRQTLVVLTRTGKAYPVSLAEVPVATGRNAKGVPLFTLLPASVQGEGNLIAASFLLPEHRASDFLLLVTQQGRVKRLALTEFADLSNRGLTLLKLKEADELAYAALVSEGDQLVFASSGGRALRLEVNDTCLPVMTRTAQGNLAMRLRQQERLVGCAVISPGVGDGSFLLISEQGYVKRSPLTQLRPAHAGELGIQVFVFSQRSDALARIVAATPQKRLMIVTNANRMALMYSDAPPLKGRDDKGDRRLKLNASERIITVTETGILTDGLEVLE